MKTTALQVIDLVFEFLSFCHFEQLNCHFQSLLLHEEPKLQDESDLALNTTKQLKQKEEYVFEFFVEKTNNFRD